MNMNLKNNKLNLSEKLYEVFKNDVSHSGYKDDVVNTPLTLKWTKDLVFETDSSPVIVNDVL
jgi:hypothetical protein